MNARPNRLATARAICTATLVLTTPLLAAGQGSAVHSDFNGDGFADLAIGVPFENFAATDDGGVNVIYGGAAGLSATGNQFWSQDTAEIAGGAESGDQFGTALAAGDFNGDGFADLAIGVPFEDFAATDDGGVNVIYGSARGLTATGNQFWSQNSTGIQGAAESFDRFGLVLAAGDFNGDGFADLAIGVPLEDFAATDDGVVHVIYGSTAGLASTGSQLWSQNSTGIEGVAEGNDHFGLSLAAANFGNSSHADLAIGVPFESFAATEDGGVNVIYGSAAGLSATGDQFWSQDSPGIEGVAETSDRFGTSLAAANFGNSTHADLAIGVPFEDFAAISDGGVNVIYGSATGLSATGDQFWSQNSAGIEGVAEMNDNFGLSLAAANFGNSTHADLAVGVPNEDLAALDDGGVNVIYGSTTGLTATGDQFWSQNSAGIEGGAESADHFGRTLAAANFGDSAHADLAVGVPYEDFASSDDGGVNVIYGSAIGLSATGDQFWSQNTAGIAGGAEATDRFGSALEADPR